MELLNGVLPYDPRLALRMAAEVVGCSKRFNDNLDSMAMKETVKLVESILADHRESVQEESSIRNLLELLDAFVEAEWLEALNLVWRSDEIYRQLNGGRFWGRNHSTPPLVVIELKKSGVPARSAFDENPTNYAAGSYYFFREITA